MAYALRRKIILTEDDYMGTIVDTQGPYKNHGVELMRYLIFPSDDLKEAYPVLQKPGVLNVNTPWGPALWREYPLAWVTDKNKSTKNPIARLHCGFDGTQRGYLDDSAELRQRNMDLVKKNDWLTIRNMTLEKELHDAYQTIEALAEKIADVNKTIKGEKYGGTEDQPQFPMEPH